jgi:hypothetical protein
MKSFSKLYSDFWVDYDNSEMLSTGIDGQLMALYLQSNTHRNMLGSYYLPLLYISSDLKLSVKKAQVALNKLCKINYCKYDEKTQHVWVCNLAFEQIGENISIKDNRIKALQAIWKSLPSKLEFLEEIYNKYHATFHLELRGFEEHPETCEIKREEVVINANAEINKSIQPATECLPLVVPPFIGVSKPLKSFSEEKSADVLKENSLESPLKISCIDLATPFEAVSDTSYSTVIMQDLSDDTINNGSSVAKGLTPSKALRSPSEAPSKVLQSPSEGPSDPLRSNIEDRSKNIEEINKKKETEEKRKKININNTTVLNSNIVTQARLHVDEKTPDKVFLFFKKPGSLEEPEEPKGSGPENPEELKNLVEPESLGETKKAKKTEKKICNQGSRDSPIILDNSNLESKLETKDLPAALAKSNLELKPYTKSNAELKPMLRPTSMPKPKIIDSKNSVNESIAAVFGHWKRRMQHPKSNLDCKRKVLIRKALQFGYSVEQLCDAITGCSHTPHNTGDNKQGQRYDGLHIILRDADQIDRFIGNCHSPPKCITEADQRLQTNLHVAKKWADKKCNGSADTTRKNEEESCLIKTHQNLQY